jgi:uncharacterized membrane protein YccC
MNFIETTLAAALGQVIAFLLYQGFVNSYWGRNSREEVTRWFDSMCKHMRKLRQGNPRAGKETTIGCFFAGKEEDYD